MKKSLVLIFLSLILFTVSAYAAEKDDVVLKEAPKPSSNFDFGNTKIIYAMGNYNSNLTALNNLLPAGAQKINNFAVSGYGGAVEIEKLTLGFILQTGASTLYTTTATSNIETNLQFFSPNLFAQYGLLGDKNWGIFTDTNIGVNFMDLTTYNTPLNGATTRNHYSPAGGFNVAAGLGVKYRIWDVWNIGLTVDYLVGGSSLNGFGNSVTNTDIGGSVVTFYISN